MMCIIMENLQGGIRSLSRFLADTPLSLPGLPGHKRPGQIAGPFVRYMEL